MSVVQTGVARDSADMVEEDNALRYYELQTKRYLRVACNFVDVLSPAAFVGVKDVRGAVCFLDSSHVYFKKTVKVRYLTLDKCGSK
jgi:hypothetical protein